MNTQFLKNRGAVILSKDKKTKLVHALFTEMDENEKNEMMKILSKKYRGVEAIRSTCDDDLSVLLFLK